MSDGPFKRFVREIHRRSLWQVLGIYLLASWAVLGGVDTLGGALGLPDWFLPVALALLVVGLPIVLATAFVQEGGPGSDEGDVGAAGSPVDAPPPGGASGLFTWRNAFGGGVLAFALWGVVAAGWVFFGGATATDRSGGEASIERSVAVLPFVNVSGDLDNEYFSDGITDELITALAQLPGVRVPGRTSSFAFKGQNLTIRQIADTLGVAHILEGSVRRDGDRVLITATLLDAQTDRQLWSRTFDRELTDIFEIQDDIARAITDQFQVTFSGDDQTQLVAEATESTEAHEAYLLGRYFWNQRTKASLRSAITEFQRAVDLDPNYTEAYSGLADSYFVVDIYVLNYEEQDYRTNLGQGLIAARRAVSLDLDLGMAHTSLGMGLFLTGEWERAEQEFELAIDLNPGYATAHNWYGFSLFSTGRATEGVTHAQRALELDPVSPVISRIVSWALTAAGRTEEAMEQSRNTVQLAPAWPDGWETLSRALLDIGRYAEGLEAYSTYARLNNMNVQLARDRYEAVIRYRETGEPQMFPDFEGGTLGISLYARSGQFDRVIEMLEDYWVQPGAYGLAANADVRYGSDLSDDPRYQALLEEAGITW